MKKATMKSIFLMAMLTLTTLPTVWAEGIRFFEGTFDQALQEAKVQGKLIFMDAYAEWCGPCKQMAKTVFTDGQVGDFYNKNFINLKRDMEKGEGQTLAKRYQVSAYPTFFFIDGNGKVISTARGGRPADQFIGLGKAALRQYDKSGDYEAEYEAGKREPEFLLKYAYALLLANKPHLKVANEYLSTQTDLTSEANLRAIFDFATEADSRIFDKLITHQTAIKQLQGEETFAKKVENACMATVEKATEFQTPALWTEAKNKYKQIYPQKAAEFDLKADMTYALNLEDASLFTASAKKYVKKFAKNNAKELHHVAQTLFLTFNEYTSSMKLAEGYAKKAAENGGQADYYLNYAKILNLNKKEAQAVEMATKAREIALTEKKDTRQIDEFLRTIKP